MARLVRISLWSIPLLLLAAVLLVSSSLYTFHSLSREALVAEVHFVPLGAQRYRAMLATGDRCRVEPYVIHGDQWRIEAQFIKWKYWANLLGLDAMYRLDRFEGRYQNVGDQNLRPKMAYSLARDNVIDMVGIAESLGGFNFLFDASYGSSTYHDIDPGRLYRVYRTQTGLITRSEPRSLADESDRVLSIEITRACGEKPGLWRRTSDWLDATLAGWR